MASIAPSLLVVVGSSQKLGFLGILSGSTTAKPVFSSFKIPKVLPDSPSHRIFGRMHEALNIGKKITNYTVRL
jgi:hypothetical protein